MTQTSDAHFKAALQLAYEAGMWAGQVDLEEHMDRQQYGDALIEALKSRKTSMPSDAYAKDRTVKYNLRSQEWRDGVRRSSQEYLDKAFSFLKESM